MHADRYLAGRCRRRAIRLVRPGDASSVLTLSVQERHAIVSGLGFAALMKRHFPEVFTQHLAARKTTARDLIGGMGAFLALAHQHLIALDGDAIRPVPFVPSDPLQAFRHPLAEWTAQNYLAQSGLTWLREPTPRVYGLAQATVIPDQGIYVNNGRPYGAAIEQHSLALLLWRLVATTPWSVMATEEVADLAMVRVGRLDLARTIGAVRPLRRATPLAHLCARLDADKPDGIRHLGTILAFVCRRTGNPFADRTADELRYHHVGDQIIDLDWRWSKARFAVLRGDQQAAAHWSSTYSRLAGRVWKEPALAATITSAIEQAAQAVLTEGDMPDGTPYDPRRLVNITIQHEVVA